MMTMHETAKLDDLITTTLDSVAGYERAAEHSDGAAYAELFAAMAAERREVAEMLQAESRRLGGTPNEFGSIAGHVHRRWEDIRHAFGGGDRAVIAEVARGEDYLKEEFERVLNDKAFSPEPLAVVQRAYESVMRGHARALAMKEAPQPQAA